MVVHSKIFKMGKSEDETLPINAPPDFDGPTEQRGCTDIIGLLLFGAMWVSFIVIGSWAISQGDYEIVINPMDYDGNICGNKYNGKDMTEFPKLVYVNNFGGGVCVKECPSLPEILTDVRTLITYNGTYQMEGDNNTILSLDYVEVADYSDSENVKACDATNCDTNPQTSWTSMGIRMQNGYADYAMDCYEVHNYCLNNPKALEKVKDTVYIPDDSIFRIESLDEAGTFLSHLYGDIFVAKYYIFLFGTFVALITGFFYTQFLRIPCTLGIMVWGSALGSVAVVCFTGLYLNRVAEAWDDDDPKVHGDNIILATRVTSYVFFGLGGISLVLLCFLRKEIMLAIACIKQAARAFGAMLVAMTLLPIFQSCVTIGILFLWVWFIIHLASMGDISTVELPTDSTMTVRVWEFDEDINRLGWLLLFYLFWILEFSKAIGQIIIAMSVAKWYFCRDKKSIGSGTVIKSISASIYYHTGTAAIGSLIIAVIRLIRALIAKLQKKAQEMDNKVGQCILCCCQCCLWCFEKFMRFLNKNAYVQTAIFGTSFCTSAKNAFFLILRNAKRVAGISYVLSVLIWISRLFIALLTAGLSYIVMEREIEEQLHSLFGPTVLVFIISYYIADMFLDIFEMSSDTILQCFIADEEMFDGEGCFADGDLRNWLDDVEERSKELVM